MSEFVEGGEATVAAKMEEFERLAEQEAKRRREEWFLAEVERRAGASREEMLAWFSGTCHEGAPHEDPCAYCALVRILGGKP